MCLGFGQLSRILAEYLKKEQTKKELNVKERYNIHQGIVRTEKTSSPQVNIGAIIHSTPHCKTCKIYVLYIHKAWAMSYSFGPAVQINKLINKLINNNCTFKIFIYYSLYMLDWFTYLSDMTNKDRERQRLSERECDREREWKRARKWKREDAVSKTDQKHWAEDQS